MKWFISCRDATTFISQQEENKLNAGQRRRLRFHLLICYMCRLFAKQTKLIAGNAAHLHDYSTACFSEEEKKEMLERIRE